MRTVQNQLRKLETLEAVRGIAALLVVLYHLQDIFSARMEIVPFGGVFGAGDRGVDLFFVLSGFIIAFIHKRDVGNPAAVGPYFFKRACRVLPAVWILTLLATVLYAFHFGGHAKAAKLDAWNFVASMLLLPQQQTALVNVTWTLKYEIFFYALFALVIANRRFGLVTLLAWQCAVLLHLFGLLQVSDWLTSYYLRPICLEFGIGMLGAWVVAHGGMTFRTPAWLTVGLLFSAIGVVAGGLLLEGLVGRHVLEPERLLIYGVAPGVAILALVKLEQTGGLRAPKILVWLGSISYAVYLTNYSVLTFAAVAMKHVTVFPVNVATLLGCVMLAVAAGGAFHAWVDAPLQSYLRRRRGAGARERAVSLASVAR